MNIHNKHENDHAEGSCYTENSFINCSHLFQADLREISCEDEFFWNETFQRLLEMPTSTVEEVVQRVQDINDLAQKFAYVCF